MTDRAQLVHAIAMLEAQRVVLGGGASVVAMDALGGHVAGRTGAVRSDGLELEGDRLGFSIGGQIFDAEAGVQGSEIGQQSHD